MNKKIPMVMVVMLLIIAVAMYMFFPDNSGNKMKNEVVVDAGFNEKQELMKSEQGQPEKDMQPELPENPGGQNSAQQLEPAVEQAVKKLVNTSHEGLVEKQTENGVSIDLQGRFRTAPVATVNEEGEVSVKDYTYVPE